MSSHTATGEWKSFEVRMRCRRAERLLARADAEAQAGHFDVARETLNEARRLAPDLPRLTDVELAIQAMEDAASRKRLDRPRGLVRYSAVAAMLLATLGIVWVGHRTPAANTNISSPPAIAAQAQKAPPSSVDPPSSRVIVEQQPITVPETALAPSRQAVEAERAPETPIEERPTPAAVTSVARNVDDRIVSTIGTVAPLHAADIAEPPRLVPSAPVAAVPVASFPSAAKPAVENSPPAEDVLVRRTLDQYAVAYSRLDADAAQQVWPSVNRGALERAFDGLALQHVSLGDCRVDVQGAAARAACAGTETWSPKIGDRGPHTQNRNWIFTLAKAGTGWQIVSARVQNK